MLVVLYLFIRSKQQLSVDTSPPVQRDPSLQIQVHPARGLQPAAAVQTPVNRDQRRTVLQLRVGRCGTRKQRRLQNQLTDTRCKVQSPWQARRHHKHDLEEFMTQTAAQIFLTSG